MLLLLHETLAELMLPFEYIFNLGANVVSSNSSSQILRALFQQAGPPRS